MKILMHICCAPCTIYPLEELRSCGHDVQGLFYNPNIHPYSEYRRRLETLTKYASQCGLHVTYEEGYDLERFLRSVTFREKDRCGYCYHDRLRRTAHLAKDGGFDGFTTTLLYSKFQNHAVIKKIGEDLGAESRLRFCYQDFRVGWLKGVNVSKELGMYRQPYCGCIYSERERFYPVEGLSTTESRES